MKSCCWRAEDIYFPEVDVENFEEYRHGGYHPTLIGDTFCDNRYTIVHKLGFRGYSTIWLARDQQLQRYVSLKILAASASGECAEGTILSTLRNGDSAHIGKQFIPLLLDQLSFNGPNGHHLCLVGQPFGCSIARCQEDSVDLMFLVDAARSIAAQLIMGLSYLQACGIWHGDLHTRNFLLRIPNFDSMSTADLYERYGTPDEVRVRRIDGSAAGPHAPPHAIYPMIPNMPAKRTLYLPPEAFFEDPITPAADIWTLGVNLYEPMGERPLFETFAWDPDDIIGEMISTLGRPPARWWGRWAKRAETPVFRPLHQRLWEMGRGETPDTCQWDVAGGELRALEDLLKSMMAFEPAERPTAERLMASEYMVKWAMPAWERQVRRKDTCARK
ncbi:CMGC/SRPK protein kinase [Phialemonium atrogriseum]|uniref:non-specific serine/threonine protein kinase n=1 Tax=Phialemonium atrogriseum TaxID=1093897 RepID=A0AAJ0FQJ9_9PEZI|nr:CMGC/SRPK protein kinase [Phialemonium atrogriseum]KAK1771314.1 CMGC/SRPK protein kinase [Phialemonium atrogriseum]